MKFAIEIYSSAYMIQTRLIFSLLEIPTNAEETVSCRTLITSLSRSFQAHLVAKHVPENRNQRFYYEHCSGE